MQYSRYQADLDKIYESEVMGERLFATAARFTRSPERHQKWRRLADLEVQTKARLIKFLGITRQQASPPIWARLEGWVFGTVLGFAPWGLSMRLLENGTIPFLEVFERLLRNSDSNTEEFFSYVVAHEKAIAEFARRERRGQTGESLTPVTQLLEPGSAQGSRSGA